MKKTRIEINHIPALVWGEKSDKVYLCVHGKMSSKESAEGIANIAEQRGYQTISFDLPGHGERQNEDKRCDIWNGIHYYQYVKEHPVQKWNIETNILFAGRDTLQSLEIVKDFVHNFNCALTLSENSEHPFMAEEDGPIVEQWLKDNL